MECRFIEREIHPLLSKPLFRIPICLLALAFTLGAWRFQTVQPDFSKNDLAWYSERESIILTGKVISFPEESSSRTVAIIKAQYLHSLTTDIEIHGKLELHLPAGFNLSYGDILLLEGPLEPVLNEKNKPYQSYSARKGIYNRMYFPEVQTISRNAGNKLTSWIYDLRQKWLDNIYTQIPFPESSLLSGILLGTDWLIPNYLQEAYRTCGLIHIIAISGFNIALVSTGIAKLSRHFLSPAKAGAVVIAAITVYTLMVGAEPAVVRAAIMGCLSVPARYFGRRVLPIHNLILVGAVMLLINPFLLWDVSFQLSFLACLGLITMVDPLQNWVGTFITKTNSEKACQFLMPAISLIITTLSAQFAVSPVIVHLSPQFSLFTLPANLAVLPIQPLLMGIGAFTLISGLFVAPIGQFAAYSVWPILAYCNRIALHFGTHPNAERTLSPSIFTVICTFVAITLLLFTFFHIRRIGQPQTTE